MKNNIHPKLYYIEVICSCNNKFNIYTTFNENFNVDVCYNCHSFYTGKHKVIKNIGRIGKFNNKYKDIFK